MRLPWLGRFFFAGPPRPKSTELLLTNDLAAGVPSIEDKARGYMRETFGKAPLTCMIDIH